MNERIKEDGRTLSFHSTHSISSAIKHNAPKITSKKNEKKQPGLYYFQALNLLSAIIQN